jgi:hypothetical protein
MFRKRLHNVPVILALAIVMFFTARQVIVTTALVNADRGYDQVEQVRAGRSQRNLQADRSYDAIENQRVETSLTTTDRSYEEVEALRTNRSAVVADRSYDQIENLRAMRTFGH